MTQKLKTDLTTGSIPKTMLAFSMPLLLGNLLQNGYNVINAIWIGQLIGGNGVGVTAITNTVTMLLISIAVGMANAAGLIISQLVGEGDVKLLQKTARQTLAITLIVGVCLTFVSVLLSPWLMAVMNTPAEIATLAGSFLKLNLSGFVMFFTSAMIMSILRGTGDTVTPMLFTLLAIALHAVLDPLLIMGIAFIPPLGLFGAALATLISQGIALTGSLTYLKRKWPEFMPLLRDFWPDRAIVDQLARIGIPFSLHHGIVALGGLAITATVNTFGAAAINAFGAVIRLEALVMMPAQSLGTALSMIYGQNIGAKSTHRLRPLTRWGVLFATGSTVVLTLLLLLAARPLLSAFGLAPGSAAAGIGTRYLWMVSTFYPVMAFYFAISGAINGTGNTFLTMLCGAASLWVVRIPLANLLGSHFGVDGIWLATSAGFFMATGLGIYFYWLKCVRPFVPPLQTTGIMEA